jgi:hypothetical protein
VFRESWNARERLLASSAPLIWTLYVLWRAPGWGFLEGVPLTPLAAGVLFFVWWVWLVRGRLPFATWVAILIVLKAIGGYALVERGFRASYFANDQWSGEAEPGLYSLGPGETRVDTHLQFRTDGSGDLPLFFINELRFNSLARRLAELPYSVIWSGELSLPAAGSTTFYVRGAGVSGEIDVDGYPVVSKQPSEEETRAQVRLRGGLRHLVVKVSGTYRAPRAFEAGLIDPTSGERQVLDGSRVIAQRVRPWRLALDWGLRWIARAIDLLLIGILAWHAGWAVNQLARRVRRAWRSTFIAFAALAAFFDALRTALPFENVLVLQGVGSDQLTYETYARDIVMHGPLMRLGAAVGRGSAYYFQALYPYFLAILHVLFGEGVWGIYLVQRLLLALTVYEVWSLSTLMFGGAIEIVALLLSIWFLYGRVAAWSQVLLSEMLFIPLLCLWTWWLTAAAARPSTQSMRTGSILTALTALSRSTVLLAWPLVAGVLGLAYKRSRKSFRPLVALLVLSCLIIGLATLRNWIVSRTFVPITSSFAVNFYLGNQPPPEIPANNRGYVGEVVNFARVAPRTFLEGLGRKALFTLGSFESLVPGSRAQPDLIATWVAAVAGGLLLVWPGVGVQASLLARSIPALVAFSHFVAVVLIFPNHGDRLILPMYVLLLPYAAIGPGLLLGSRRRTA